ncbi:MAG: FlgO family outer membrane protein [Gemmatimonadota bacterium]
MLERSRDPRRNADCLIDRQPAFAIEALAKCFVGDVRHDVVEQASRFAGIEEWQDVHMLQHPHILPLFDSGVAAGLLFYVMPYVSGETLRQRLEREGPLPIEKAVRIATDIASALDYAHRNGVIHRDLKPENVLLQDEVPMLADFGVALAVSAAGGERLTRTGLVVGTPQYLSPEQATGSRQAGPPADVYALGAVLYEMLAGERPFTGATAEAVIARALLEPPRPIRSVRPTISPVLEAAVIKALAKTPADRFASAAAFATALTTGAAPQRNRSGLRNRKLAWMGAFLIVAAALSVLMARWTVRERDAAAAEVDASRIVVLPFHVVTADQAIRVLGEGMAELLTTKLDKSGLATVDAATTLSVLQRTGGAEGQVLTRDSAQLVARKLGAGKAVVGAVIGMPGCITINAELIDVVSGEPIGRGVAEGVVDSLTHLIDVLAAQIIGLGLGDEDQRLSMYTTASYPAVQEYLRGRHAFVRSRFPEAQVHFARAMELDSTFAMPSLYYLLASGYAGSDLAERAIRLACAFRSKLGARDQLRVVAFAECPDAVGVSAFALNPRVLNFIEHSVNTMPDDAALWARLGDYLFHFAIGTPGWKARAMTAFERALAFERPYEHVGEPLGHLLVLKADARDTAAVRRLSDRLSRSDTAGFWPVESVWLRAALLGDTATSNRLHRTRFAELLATNDASAILLMNEAQGLGVRVQDAELAAAILQQRADSSGNVAAMNWARELGAFVYLNVGRPSQAPGAPTFWGGWETPATRRVLEALFWDRQPASVQEQVARLSDFVRVIPQTGQDSLITAWAHCALGLWHMNQADTMRARPHVAAALHTTVGRIPGTQHCHASLLALQAFARTSPDRFTRLEQLDSLTRRAPGRYSATVGDLVAARLFERSGRPERALQAVRRNSPYGAQVMLSSLLREEGRLALITGDTAGAIHAYRHFLTLRYNPEPRLRPEVDRIRQQVALLERRGLR